MASPTEHADLNEKNAESQYLMPDDAVSPTESREQESRLVDGLEVLRVERLVSSEEQEQDGRPSRSKSRRHHPIEDAFNQPATSSSDTRKQDTLTALNRLWILIKKFPRFIRYFVYMLPIGALLMIPILLDVFAFTSSNAPVGGPGGVKLMWFGIWLEVVWLSLWISRILCAILPPIFKFVAGAVGSTTPKKWREIGSQLELHTALFLWMLAVLCSFYPIVNNNGTRDEGGHWENGEPPYLQWVDIVNKVIISLFVLATLNFLEKILIQWIATSFHMRTYAYRIENNRVEIQFLVQLFEYSKAHTQGSLPWDPLGPGQSSGNRTPMQAFQDNAKHVWGKVANSANRMAHDFTGRKVMKDDHPQMVVNELLRSTPQSHTLARMIYRTFVRSDRQTITPEDLVPAFPNSEDAEACFGVFDKDLNGDISMEEMEMVCNEIHLEKKAIAASLKDLDSVIRKLDKVFFFIIFVIAAIVFISIISGSAAAALGSAGTTVLGLAWMLQATAQEFLQSIIFVFVKHPFDVGDRVTVYGNTGSNMRGDDYYVQAISLLYTEFKKMEGHVVQAPNSLLNELFILNQRRSNGLADPIELKMRFGTPSSLIEELKNRMLDFVMENKRDYAPRIITEVRTIDEVWSVTINFIFFHKTNFQNELLRLQRHNKFAGELMRQMSELGIEGPRKMQPGGTKDYPFFWTNIQPPQYSESQGTSSNPPQMPTEETRRRRAESRATVVDRGPDFQDVYESRRGDPMQRLQSIREPGAQDNRVNSPVERLESRSSGFQRQRTFLHRHPTSRSKDMV